MTKPAQTAYFEQAKLFFRCREELSSLWTSINTGKLSAWDSFDEITSQQMNCSGAVVSTMAELYEAASKARDVFADVLRLAASSAKLPEESVMVASLKGADRAAEKARDDYSEKVPGPAISWLFDIVRGSVLCDSEDEIVSLFEALQMFQKEGLLQIIRLKNRFLQPTPGGFRDINMNISVRFPSMNANGEAIMVAHICELQVHHHTFKDKAKELRCHDVYSYFRTYFKGNTDAVAHRLELLEQVGLNNSDDVLNHSVQAIADDAIADGSIDRLHNAKQLLHLISEFPAALKVQRKLVEVLEERVGRLDPRCISQVKDLGEILLMDINDYTQAEVFISRALEDYTTSVGEDDERTRYAFLLLGSLYFKKGDRVKAREIFQKVFDYQRNALGIDNRLTLLSATNLATTLLGLGEYEEAKKLHTLVMTTREEKLGPFHSDTLGTYYALASVEATQGHFQTALALMNKAIAGYERIYGPDAPLTLSALTGAASVNEDLGNYAVSTELFTRILNIQREVLGTRHSHTLVTMTKLGLSLLKNSARVNEGVSVLEEAYAAAVEAFGADHRDTLDVLSALGAAASEKGDCVMAEDITRKSLNAVLKIYGPDHTNTFSSYANLANALADLNQLNEALGYFQLSLEGFKTALGSTHMVVSLVGEDTGSLLVKLGRLEEARDLFINVLDIRKGHLAETSPKMLAALSDLGRIHMQLGRYEEACRYLEKCLEGHVSVSGPVSGNALTIADLLIQIYQEKLHDWIALLPFLEQVCKGSAQHFGEKADATVRREAILRACRLAIAAEEQQAKAPGSLSSRHSSHPAHELELRSGGECSCSVCDRFVLGLRYTCMQDMASSDASARQCSFFCCLECIAASVSND